MLKETELAYERQPRNSITNCDGRLAGRPDIHLDIFVHPRAMKTRYFHFPDDPRGKRVIVFPAGKESGLSYWSDGTRGLAWWFIEDMERDGAKEITRPKALRKVRKLPK